jgi:hypothetical protein
VGDGGQGPTVLKGQSHGMERGAAKLQWAFCLMQGRQSTVKNGWGGRGAQRKGPKIGKGMSHEILNTVKNNGEDGARSAKAQILYCKGTVTRDSKHC